MHLTLSTNATGREETSSLAKSFQNLRTAKCCTAIEHRKTPQRWSTALENHFTDPAPCGERVSPPPDLRHDPVVGDAQAANRHLQTPEIDSIDTASERDETQWQRYIWQRGSGLVRSDSGRRRRAFGEQGNLGGWMARSWSRNMPTTRLVWRGVVSATLALECTPL